MTKPEENVARTGAGPSTPRGQARVPLDAPARPPSAVHVFVGVGGLLVLLAVAVLVAVVLVLDVRDATQRADRDVDYAGAIHSARLNAKVIANDERGFLLSGNREFVDQMPPAVEKARAAFAAAERDAPTATDRRIVYEASEGFERWLVAVEAEIARFRAGDRTGAVETSLGRTRKLRHTYEASLLHAQNLADSGAESSTSSLSATSWRSVRILLVYLVAALAVGFVLTVWLVRAFLRPVSTLLRLAPDARDDRLLR